MAADFETSFRLSDFAPGLASPSQFYQHCNPSLQRFPFFGEFKTETINDILPREYTYNIDATRDEDQRKDQIRAIKDLVKHANAHRKKFNSLLPPPGLSDLKYVDTRVRGREYIRSKASHKPSLRPDLSFFAVEDAETALNVQFIGDYKVEKNQQGSFTDTDLGSMMGYLRCLMYIEQPFRKQIYGFLLNSEKIQFVRCVRESNNELTWTITDHLPVRKNKQTDPWPQGLNQLLALLVRSSSELGFERIRSSIEQVQPTEFLGRGASALVFGASSGGVLKIFKKEPEGIKEGRVLEILNGAGVPNIPECVNKNGDTLHLRPRARALKVGLFKTRHALQALETLQQAHAAGWIHRDFRPENLMLAFYNNESDSLLVNDWGFAVQKKEICEYNGTIICASDRILDLIASGSDTFEVLPSDDYESFLRTLFCICFPRDSPTFDKQVRQIHNNTNPNIKALCRATKSAWQARLYIPAYVCYSVLQSLFSTLLIYTLLLSGVSVKPNIMALVWLDWIAVD